MKLTNFWFFILHFLIFHKLKKIIRLGTIIKIGYSSKKTANSRLTVRNWQTLRKRTGSTTILFVMESIFKKWMFWTNSVAICLKQILTCTLFNKFGINTKNDVYWTLKICVCKYDSWRRYKVEEVEALI